MELVLLVRRERRAHYRSAVGGFVSGRFIPFLCEQKINGVILYIYGWLNKQLMWTIQKEIKKVVRDRGAGGIRKASGLTWSGPQIVINHG